MRTRIVDLHDESSMTESAHLTSSRLMKGGVVLYPSDTVYGLLCRADDTDAVARIRRMKDTSVKRPFILLVGGTDMACALADCSDPEITEIMRLRWPGRLTLVLPALDSCPEWVRDPDGSVALRQPDQILSRLILDECRVPLVSTSANRSGREPCLDFDQVEESLKASVDLALDAGKLPRSSPSTIIKLIRSQ